MAELEIRQIPVLRDNYVYLLREPESGAVAAVDPSVAAPVAAALDGLGWKLTHILNTHHHNDHTGGNLELKAATGSNSRRALGRPRPHPRHRRGAGRGRQIQIRQARRPNVFDVPGHTRGHMRLLVSPNRARCSAATRCSSWAAAGCSRARPRRCGTRCRSSSGCRGDTRIYCGHEYTQANARFALTVEPGNRGSRRPLAARRRVARPRQIHRAGHAWPRSWPPTRSCAPTTPPCRNRTTRRATPSLHSPLSVKPRITFRGTA